MILLIIFLHERILLVLLFYRERVGDDAVPLDEEERREKPSCGELRFCTCPFALFVVKSLELRVYG